MSQFPRNFPAIFSQFSAISRNFSAIFRNWFRPPPRPQFPPPPPEASDKRRASDSAWQLIPNPCQVFIERIPNSASAEQRLMHRETLDVGTLMDQHPAQFECPNKRLVHSIMQASHNWADGAQLQFTRSACRLSGS